MSVTLDTALPMITHITMTIRIIGIMTTIIIRMVTIHRITSEGDAKTAKDLTDATTDKKDVMDEKDVNGTINGDMSGFFMECSWNT